MGGLDTFDPVMSQAETQLESIHKSVELEHAKLKHIAERTLTHTRMCLVVQKWMNLALSKHLTMFGKLDVGKLRTKAGLIVEHLMALLLKLDGVSSNGNRDIRDFRRAIVHHINRTVLPLADEILNKSDQLVLLQKQLNLQFAADSEAIDSGSEASQQDTHANEEAQQAVDASVSQGATQAHVGAAPQAHVGDTEDSDSDSDSDDDSDSDSESDDDAEHSQATRQRSPQPADDHANDMEQEQEQQDSFSYSLETLRNAVVIHLRVPSAEAMHGLQLNLEVQPRHKQVDLLHASAPGVKSATFQLDRGSIAINKLQTSVDGDTVHIVLPRRSRARPQPSRQFAPQRMFHRQPRDTAPRNNPYGHHFRHPYEQRFDGHPHHFRQPYHHRQVHHHTQPQYVPALFGGW